MTNLDIHRLYRCLLGLMLGLVVSTALAQSKKPAPKTLAATTPGVKSPATKLPAAKAPVKKATPTAVAKEKEAAQKKAGPNTAQLRALVEQTLAKNPYYSPGFLISRRDVETLFAKMLAEGITAPDDQEDLSESVLAESSFLAVRLKTPVGREFMKKILHDKTAYDRLERLSWSPDGRKLIDSLIAAKDGPAQLQQLKTPEQLAKISKKLAADPHTADFAVPTDRAHTADELVAKLEEILSEKSSE